MPRMPYIDIEMPHIPHIDTRGVVFQMFQMPDYNAFVEHLARLGGQLINSEHAEENTRTTMYENYKNTVSVELWTMFDKLICDSFHHIRHEMRVNGNDTINAGFRRNNHPYAYAVGMIASLAKLSGVTEDISVVPDGNLGNISQKMRELIIHFEEKVLKEEGFRSHNMCDHCFTKYGLDSRRKQLPVEFVLLGSPDLKDVLIESSEKGGPSPRSLIIATGLTDTSEFAFYNASYEMRDLSILNLSEVIDTFDPAAGEKFKNEMIVKSRGGCTCGHCPPSVHWVEGVKVTPDDMGQTIRFEKKDSDIRVEISVRDFLYAVDPNFKKIVDAAKES